MKAAEMMVSVPGTRVVDYDAKVCAKAVDSGVDLADMKPSMNYVDEILAEAAIRPSISATEQPAPRQAGNKLSPVGVLVRNPNEWTLA